MTMKLRSNHVPGELLVRLKPNHSLASEENSSLAQLGKVAARYPLGGAPALQDSFSSSEILHLKLHDQSPEALEKAVQELQDNPGVAYAVTNDIVEAFGEVRPNDLHSNLYGMERVL